MSRELPDALQELFETHFGKQSYTVSHLQEHASPRKRYRIHTADGSSYIAVDHQNPAENKSFHGFNSVFRSLGLKVPEIYCHNLEQGVYILPVEEL